MSTIRFPFTSDVMRRAVALALIALVALAAVWLTLLSAKAARLDPADDHCVKVGGGDGCFATISEALAAANAGDTIRVAGGLYIENVGISQTVHLQGGWNESFTINDTGQFSSTILPANNTLSVVAIDGVFSDTAHVAPTLEGFHITGGRAQLGSNHGGGIAIRNSNAVISNNRVISNVAFLLGGGIWVQNGAPLLQNNVISNNMSTDDNQDSFGGGVMLEGTAATLLGNVVAGNQISVALNAEGFGAGIDMVGVDTVQLVDNLIISNNLASGSFLWGGGLSVRSGAADAQGDEIRGNGGTLGGGIYNLGSYSLTQGLVLSNTGGIFGGGLLNVGRAALTGVTIAGNESEQGGGLVNVPVVVASSRFALPASFSAATSGASVARQFGELWISEADFSRNRAANGAALLNIDSTATIERSSFISNTARFDGGAIFNIGEGYTQVYSSTIALNRAMNGAGIYNGDGGDERLELRFSAAYSNAAAASGGGIWNVGIFSATNSTIGRNMAGESGGGLFTPGTASLFEVTLAENEAPLGAGIHAVPVVPLRNGQTPAVAQAILGGTIVDDNLPANCQGTIFSQGFNLEDGVTCALVPALGDQPLTDPQLGALANWGGETQTFALSAGSPAIDAAGEACSPTDQRGVPRPQDGDNSGTALCDIGAFEFAPDLPPTPTPTPTATPTITPTPTSTPAPEEDVFLPAVIHDP